MFISFKVQSPDVAQNTQIQLDSTHARLTYNDTEIVLELANEIISSDSTHTAVAKKIELKLKKSVDGAQWLKIEKDGEAKLIATGQVT